MLGSLGEKQKNNEGGAPAFFVGRLSLGSAISVVGGSMPAEVRAHPGISGGQARPVRPSGKAAVGMRGEVLLVGSIDRATGGVLGAVHIVTAAIHIQAPSWQIGCSSRSAGTLTSANHSLRFGLF